MPSTVGSRPAADTFDIEQLVALAWAGHIRIPHFQRDFRWGWQDVYRLFDSIVKGYPIGSLLLWKRKAEAQEVRLGALTVDAPEMADALWVVDGQQRLTSLANSLHQDGRSESRFALSYSLLESDFVRTPQAEDPLVIPLPTLFDLQGVLKWFARYPEISDYLDHVSGLTRRIRQYEVPAYLVTEDDPRILQDIFDRMNNFGKRLSRAEIFSALNAGEETEDGNTSEFEKIARRIDEDFNFGLLDNDTVLAAILARRGPEVRRDIRSEFTRTNDEGRDAAYRAGEVALRNTVRFLQSEAGVPHVSFLSYRYLLVVLTRVFAFFPNIEGRNLRLLRRWYWQAATIGPEQFKGSTPNAARILCAKVTVSNEVASIQGLLAAVKTERKHTPSLQRFSTNEAATKIVLSCWWARSPRNPETGERYEIADIAADLLEQRTARDVSRYLVPRSSVASEMKPWAANRALMPRLELDGRELVARLAQRPIDMSSALWESVLDSHSIDDSTARLLADNEIERFLRTRQSRLQAELSDFLDRACEWDFENTPPLSSLVLDDDDAEEYEDEGDLSGGND
ncbi:MAG: DUF262 domain-containing protein [Kineosporiaceae bacterium]|nr:DUF262 domain-containing protein [Kineosporiaceae bacterium]